MHLESGIRWKANKIMNVKTKYQGEEDQESKQKDNLERITRPVNDKVVELINKLRKGKDKCKEITNL